MSKSGTPLSMKVGTSASEGGDAARAQVRRPDGGRDLQAVRILARNIGVDFPDADGPIIPTIAPGTILKLKSLNKFTPL